jgi:hypothetical protein
MTDVRQEISKPRFYTTNNMLNHQLILLTSGYILIIALCAYLIRKWIIAPTPKTMPRYKTIRLLNLVAIVAASVSSMALMTGYYVGQHFSFAGVPILILIFALCSSPKRYNKQQQKTA